MPFVPDYTAFDGSRFYGRGQGRLGMGGQSTAGAGGQTGQGDQGGQSAPFLPAGQALTGGGSPSGAGTGRDTQGTARPTPQSQGPGGALTGAQVAGNQGQPQGSAQQTMGQTPSGAGGGGGFTSFAQYLNLNPDWARQAAAGVLSPLQGGIQGAQTGFDTARSDFERQLGQAPTYPSSRPLTRRTSETPDTGAWWQTPTGSDFPAPLPAQGFGTAPYYSVNPGAADEAARRQQAAASYQAPTFGSDTLRGQMQSSARDLGLLNIGPVGWQALSGNPYDQSWGAAAQGAAAQAGGAGRAAQLNQQFQGLSNAFGKYQTDAQGKSQAAQKQAQATAARYGQDIGNIQKATGDWQKYNDWLNSRPSNAASPAGTTEDPTKWKYDSATGQRTPPSRGPSAPSGAGGATGDRGTTGYDPSQPPDPNNPYDPRNRSGYGGVTGG